MPHDEVSRRVANLIDPIVTEEGCELVDVALTHEHGRRILRVLVDKDGGVSVDDCSRVSQSIEDLIEVEEVVPGRYDLEVSSPGLDRPLVKPKHFQNALGKTVKIQTVEKIDGRQNYKGVLKTAGDEEVVVEVDAREFRLPLKLIRRANLVFGA